MVRDNGDSDKEGGGRVVWRERGEWEDGDEEGEGEVYSLVSPVRVVQCVLPE